MSEAIDIAAAADLLYREGHHLDAQRWDDWLALYCADAVFWVPAWKDEHALVDAPDREVSLMYHAARSGLEDRVWRVRSGLSAASTTLPRTSHAITGVVIDGVGADGVAVRASWNCHIYDLRQCAQHVLFGRYEHLLRRESAGWRIARKKVTLMNDRIPTMLDFYCV